MPHIIIAYKIHLAQFSCGSFFIKATIKFVKTNDKIINNT